MLVEAIYIYIISKILKTKFKISFPDSHTHENNSREKGKRKKTLLISEKALSEMIKKKTMLLNCRPNPFSFNCLSFTSSLLRN
jgi:hypothetical protein